MNFSEQIISWYNDNKRELPWRNTTDAYIIWLSEIILQQTRVEQGLPYFYRFLERFPDISSFANAREDEILNLWQGLGYYSRGRNMLKTAQLIQDQYNGVFPVKYDDLIKLKGIGEYTAAAISSFAANETRAVVDGNVSRVLARYLGIDEPINSTKGKKIFQNIADELLDLNDPATHNQAIMEFGAIICKPKNPACGTCVLRLDCVAFKTNAIKYLPVKLKKVKIRERFFNYLLITDGEKILMNKRGENDIWANMYEMPLVETNTLLEIDELVKLPQLQQLGDKMAIKGHTTIIKHVLTHQHLYIRFIELRDFPENLQKGWFYTDVNNLDKLALPRSIFIFIKKFFNF
ncbi:A/G-specific adenine glycosylase [Mucilaginibacter segetis]|uniref:Adenine DNA glycosylase n=1 Tax=Mucilaginibacter segetis TaxID=2793071 RepID=A0A934UN04_9SPHI|nr:A/G-specific adenine glycosylase [Mucilaginibacter segetis]MBK0380258.1 A/G-specific adenine glycosylase [Mucilaginibacter segetis]